MSRLITLRIGKQSHKFSAAHFTIFSGSERERLHGHNYFVSLRIAASIGPEGFSADYNVYKKRLQQLCDAYDEYMLLAGNSPHLVITGNGDQLKVVFNEQLMYFRADETIVLPVVNITVEELSNYLLERLLEDFDDPLVHELELGVASGPGQEASAVWQRT
jgi:6-pyruvoyltetrahydropterin/6-carboxytetrahydropterin synthase